MTLVTLLTSQEDVEKHVKIIYHSFCHFKSASISRCSSCVQTKAPRLHPQLCKPPIPLTLSGDVQTELLQTSRHYDTVQLFIG